MTNCELNPGAVGIPYRDANCFLDALEASGSEMHALCIMRHGIQAMEGYWAPYRPGQIHGSQSLTKTMTGVALGVAMQEGLLTLDDRLTDIFPEYACHTAGKPWWDELRVRHIASMGAGMEQQPPVTSADWQEAFFHMDIVHQPGTAFFYNSVACSMVGACIRKKTDLGLLDFLSDRVLRKIGIDPQHLRWHKHPDGQENGSGGLISDARENALMMELYRRGGVWQGERLLAENWVRFALRVENPHTGGENTYGGMMWVWKNCFAADGAMGQWALYFPREDMILSLSQTISSMAQDKAVRLAIDRFAGNVQDGETPWTAEEIRAFQARLESLHIPMPEINRNETTLQLFVDKQLRVTEGTAHFYADDLCIFNPGYLAPIQSFGFHRDGDGLILEVTACGRTDCVPVDLNGQRTVTLLTPLNGNPARTVSVAGWCPEDRTLVLEVRWLESCRVHRITFNALGSGAQITTSRLPVGGFDVPDETALASIESTRS